jgi:hypothetical protein
MKSKIHISQVNENVKIITYQRNPTEYEIKFGYEAPHYRDFDIEECFDSKGFLKRTIVAKNDRLKYQYS